MEYTPHVQTIQVVLENDLLRAADRAAKRVRMNRSALIREALRQHLKRMELRELERRDRRGYERHPEGGRAASEWERVAAWPED